MTETQKTHLTTHLDVPISVGEDGHFYATPKGCRKERCKPTLREIKREIEDQTKSVRRPPVNEPVRLWLADRSTYYPKAVYKGLRLKATRHLDAGHIFVLTDTESTSRNHGFHVVRDTATDQELHELETLSRRVKALQTEFEKAQARLTRRVHLPYFAHVRVTDAQRHEDAVVNDIRLARAKERAKSGWVTGARRR